MRLYYEVARRSFQRQLQYRAAALAGVVTNCFFGCIKAFVFIALYHAQSGGEVSGYVLRDAITFVWLAQGMIAIMAIWGWSEIADTIRTGTVVTDLSRPYDYYHFWLARDIGRAICQFLLRGIPSFLVGGLLFGVSLPVGFGQWFLFALSLSCAVVISFALRFLQNIAAFWVIDIRGIAGIWNIVVTLLSGFEIPLVYFPTGLRRVCNVFPFRGMIQTPVDLFLNKQVGVAAFAAIGQQALWAVVLVLVGRAVTLAATRKVVVQGG